MMMKFMFMMISLLLLSILSNHQAHGIRLIERSEQAGKDLPKNTVHEEKSNGVGILAAAAPEKEKGGAESSGSKRILMTKNSTPSTTTTSKNDVVKGKSSSSERSVVGGKEENLAVNSSPVPGRQHSSPATTINVPAGDDQYPDIVDIEDYSPAKRKPPIHN